MSSAVSGKKSKKSSKKREAVAPAKAAPIKEAKIKKNAKKSPEVKKDGFFVRAGNFFREVKQELQKVVWPTRKETIASTVVVLVVVLAASIYLGLADFILSSLLSLLVN